MTPSPIQPDTEAVARTYGNLIDLWTSGVRDYHSLLSDYLTANSIFVVAIGFLSARKPEILLFTLLVVILCTFGILLTIQMAIVLGRFSTQVAYWEWQLRGLERSAGWGQRALFCDFQRVRDKLECLVDRENDPPEFRPSWAFRQHRQWWARREISFPLFFGIVYGLFLAWGVTQFFE